ncbi:hypothetical protein KVR01_007550 [Diaporthe batatas]|uniref:uncharacterized protein n=1 Tax=Diaporthe batatas TaxID=748121 RepID=UPI001D03CF72|nr:uncharacterized protein KVR01_007550 [Diaporthe batatas]KAG8163072.1 hypothetical protein KVR01_007550 [Diaporthe batatas]
MQSILLVVLGSFTAVYVFLRLVLYLTQDRREPPAILTGIPFIGPLVGMIRERSDFHVRLRDTYKLPIHTLRLPFSRIYVVNSRELIPALQKQYRSISFAAISADAGFIVGISKQGNELLHRDLTSEHGFSLTWPKYIMTAMGPGKELDSINRRSIQVFAQDMDELRANGTAVKTGLMEWARGIMIKSTTEAVWGPQNPYRDSSIAEAWKTFEKGFLTLSVFPLASVFFPKLYRARELATAALVDYTRKGGYKTASGLVRMRFEHHVKQWGLSLDDFGRGELGNTFAVLGNSTPCALWFLFHILSDKKVLDDVRKEVSAMVTVNEDDDCNCIDLAAIRKACPILLSTFQETLRVHSVNPGVRMVLEEVLLNDEILLKKGSLLMIPTPVQHTDTSAWGPDVNTFDHLRFARKPGQRKHDRVAFRSFGGGHVLCPGRHFASTEIMALAALLVLQFDVVATGNGGAWIEPTSKNSPIQAGFAVPDSDIDVELRPRDPTRKWRVTFTGSDEAIGIVSEDIEHSGN